jgi:hypothetical protein
MYDQLKVMLEKPRSGSIKRGITAIKDFSNFTGIPDKLKKHRVRESLVVLFFLFTTIPVLAPESNFLVLGRSSGINPYMSLLYAVGMVETQGNTLAYNEFENAAGIFQIRQVRVDDYNRRTGSDYVLGDMFDYSVSERIFLYFASAAGPYEFEKIAKSWNGSGPMTEHYWKRVKKYLD